MRCSYDIEGETTEAGRQRREWLWCACQVLQVSDGTVRQVSERTGKPLRATYAAGFVLVRWYANLEMGEEEESEEWLPLQLKKWNTQRDRAWRRNLDVPE